MHTPTREEAYGLLTEYNDQDGLIKHALAVEAVMRYAARQRGGDEDAWGIVGLVHDLDYGRFPEQHCAMTARILRERDWPEEFVHAVVSHGWGLCSDVEPTTEMENVLYAVDELCGLVTAAVLVRPSRSLHDLEVKSLKKKWKDKGFAAGANRDVIEKGAARLGITVEDLMAETIAGMREAAAALGLEGSMRAMSPQGGERGESEA
ncbi:MAG: HDIG domain-containing metalloprotein [Candidatus Bipolaricaulia bacterium]